ncbi:bifunctional apoptosis regulator-like isoform X2 [Megalobrama amblycephala]|uniref:bifunctional apoptosis regulator-like isoform X2 n=1 Tax=Megalobrama amblycephala TaxID=75352 RepID=UPI002013ECD7|nr:bifunctional apoptosis regulator-like isoform X2 [Megalobrama amblycephala]
MGNYCAVIRRDCDWFICSAQRKRLMESEDPSAGLSTSEFTCHCCYEVLVDPTTLTCGHSFCRHCLATWWASTIRTDCPECQAIWQGFPKVNILLRDAVEKLFAADVSRRKQAVLSDPWLRHVLLAFQQQGETPGVQQRWQGWDAPAVNHVEINLMDLYSGVTAVLSCVVMVLLVYRTFTADSSHEMLLSKPLSRWSASDVTLWVEQLGVWTNHYKETFHREQINGRSLSALSDEDLSAAPFMIENQSHRRIILEELHKLRALQVSLNLWQYKDLNPGKTLFLLVSLRSSPRLTLLHLFLFDYGDTFLPFIHTCCPATRGGPADTLDWPGWQQWAEFLLMYFLLPHQLLAAFAEHWLSVHCWTAGVVIVHATLMTVLDVSFYWTLWTRGEMRTLPKKLWLDVSEEMADWFLLVLLWPLVPLFIVNIDFYCQLFIKPFHTATRVKQTLLQTDR